MALINRLILKNLDELKQDDFERFKSSLTSTMAEGFEPIPRSKLEKATQIDVVERMMSQYGPAEAADITVKVLKDIGQNRLAMDLEKKLKGNVEGSKDKVQAGGVDGEASSSSSSSTQAAGFSQSISAGGPSSVQAPVLSGGNYHGPVTMNFNNPK